MNQEKMNQIIRNYLTSYNLDLALYINGPWGIGKTFYYFNTVQKLIRETLSITGEKYEPIYISLNGISSTEQILTQLASNILAKKIPDKLKKNIPNKVSSLLYGIINTISVVLKDKELKDLNKIDVIKFIDFRNKVICFDDIERISDKVSIDEVLGFISRNFLENINTKVIVIGSEVNLETAIQSRFKTKKEKVFNIEINFELDYTNSFDSLCSQTLTDNKLAELLKDNQKEIINSLKLYKIENLRTIRKILQTLDYSFPYFDPEFFKDLFKSIILFTIIFTKEAKENNLNLSLDEAYTKLNYHMDNRVAFAALAQSKNNPEVSGFPFSFYLKYIKPNKEHYNFFQSIYSYITNGHAEVQLFSMDEKELRVNIKDSLFDKLQWFSDLSNEKELKKVCDDFLVYIVKGDLVFYNYPYIFSKYENLIENQIYDKNLEELFNLFKSGLDIAFNAYDAFLIDENKDTVKDSDSQYLRTLKEKVVFYHEEIKVRKEKIVADKFLAEITFGNGIFEPYLQFFYMKSLFSYFPTTYLSNRLINSPPRIISAFTTFLYQKYKTDNYLVLDDIEKLKNLITEIKTGLNTVNDNLKRYTLDGIIDQAEKSLSGLLEKKNSNMNNTELSENIL